eukprot:5946999-Lingulodinium_polyedra.AAC.1
MAVVVMMMVMAVVVAMMMMVMAVVVMMAAMTVMVMKMIFFQAQCPLPAILTSSLALHKARDAQAMTSCSTFPHH